MQLTTLVGIPTSVSMFKEQEEKHHRAGKPSSTLVFINLKRELENVPHHHLVKRNKINYCGKGKRACSRKDQSPRLVLLKQWVTLTIKEAGGRSVPFILVIDGLKENRHLQVFCWGGGWVSFTQRTSLELGRLVQICVGVPLKNKREQFNNRDKVSNTMNQVSLVHIYCIIRNEILSMNSSQCRII